MLKEFKDFAMRGNVLDMAVGIIIGAAFSKIVTSLVNDILMPPIGMIVGRVDFSNLFVNLASQPFESLAKAKEAGAPTINYGVFLQSTLDFLIVAFVIFMLVRQVNRWTRKPEPASEVPTTKPCPYCLSDIPLKATRCRACTADVKAA